MAESKQEKLNILSCKIDKLLNHIELLDQQIKDDFEEIFECNKKAFEIYTDIKKGDWVLFRNKKNRKEKLETGIFNGFSRSNTNRAHRFSLINDKKEVVYEGFMQMGKEEFERFSKVVKFKIPFNKLQKDYDKG
jgi:hypothetical protein